MKLEQAKARAEVLKALANPVRLVLVDALRQGDLCVRELNRLVRIGQSNVSRHLAQLKKVGIVTEHRRGPRVYHHLETPCILRTFDCAAEVLKSYLRRRASSR